MSRSFLYRLSLVLNAILIVTLVLWWRTHNRSAQSATENLPQFAPVAVSTTVVPRYPASYPTTAEESDRRRWLIDQLRAMGVPNPVLARIVEADLDATWTRQTAAAALKCHGDPQTMAALQLEIDLGKDAVMRAALGEAGFKAWDHANLLREINSGKVSLTMAETDAAYDLWKKFQTRSLAIKKAQIQGQMDEADASEAYDQATAELGRQMQDLLGADRYAQARQTDPAASAAGLRQEFAAANPSEDQFQSLLKTQQQWNEQRAALDRQFQATPEDSNYADQLKALEAARDQEYQRVLGTNAFDNLQKQSDTGFALMKKYENLWGLNDTKIDSVYAAMKYYQKSVADYESDVRSREIQGQTVDWAAVNRDLQQFSAVTGQTLQTYLGADNYQRMLQNGVFQLSPPDLSAHRQTTH